MKLRASREENRLIDIMSALTDPELGYTAFTVQRITYIRQNGTSVPSSQTFSASGCIHPGTPEMLQLLPEEDRHEEFIVIYTDFALSFGANDGGAVYTAPDRIVWKGETWRVIRIHDWGDFGYRQAMAIKMRE